MVAGEAFRNTHDAGDVSVVAAWSRVDGWATYRYEHDAYPSLASGFASHHRRSDDLHSFGASVSVAVVEHIRLRVSYEQLFDDSRISSFDYDREVVDLAVEARF